jgi:hypothetical protein
LLQPWIGNEISHGTFNLAPRRCGEHAITMREIHRLKILKEPIEERAESELRNSVQIVERLQTPQENCAKFAAIVKRPGELAPLLGQSMDRRLPAFFGLLADLSGELNQRRNPNAHRRQLADGCQHFPVHVFGTITVLT